MALNPEFQRKMQLQAAQYKSQGNATPGQTEHPEDILAVRNILVGCDDLVEEPIPYARAKTDIDPNTGTTHFVNRIENDVYAHSWNTKDYFEVRWDGRPHRIAPGATRKMPRYLADHFAKHLIDYILVKREREEKKLNLVQNKAERVKLYKQIIVEVESYYNEDLFNFDAEGQYAEQQVNALNQPADTSSAIDLGQVPNAAIGYASDTAPEKLDDEPALAPPQVEVKSTADLMANRSRQDLMKEAKQLGITLTGKETKDQVFQLITNF